MPVSSNKTTRAGGTSHPSTCQTVASRDQLGTAKPVSVSRTHAEPARTGARAGCCPARGRGHDQGLREKIYSLFTRGVWG